VERGKVNKEFILFTSTNFPTGGAAATYLNLFCKGVKENGDDISVYLFKGYVNKDCKRKKGRINSTDEGINYTYLGFANRPKKKFLKFVEDLVSILRTTGSMLTVAANKKNTTVLVYSDEFFFNLPVYLLSKLFRIKLVSFVPEYYDKDELKKMGLINRIKWNLFLLNFNFLNKLTDKLIVFSVFLKNEYITRGYSLDNILIQPNLTDLSEWPLFDEAPEYTVGYAGIPSKKDGVADLITSISLLNQKGVTINALIIGDSWGNESYTIELKSLCAKLNISSQVFFTGLVSKQEVKNYLNKCQILTLTRPDTKQTKAGFPTKLGEYLACRKVVLATRFGDIEQYFTDKKDIVLAQPGNPASIAESILWILNNPEQTKRLTKNGFETASNIFDYHKGVKRIINFLN
jgi:glycosyltransferase involved in cell wall biosynthesis